jgi:inosine-uridine nucleoside N-ribohydrolase
MTLDVILDTDMGPDCDDAGALAVLHALVDAGKANILGVTYCTSIPTGPACVDAINRFYGRPDIPVGALAKEGFLRGASYERYTPFIAAHFDNRFKTAKAPDAVSVVREVLAQRPDCSVEIIGIGPFVNLADLLASGPDGHSSMPGIELVRTKVRRLVAMGGRFALNDRGEEEAEWNIVQDIGAAQEVMRSWPTPVVLSPSEAGGLVMTGKGLMARCGEDNPVKKAYDIYTEGHGRNSWDLVTVYFAVCGESGMWELSEPGTIDADVQGITRLRPDAQGSHRYLIAKAPVPQVEALLEPLLMKPPRR